MPLPCICHLIKCLQPNFTWKPQKFRNTERWSLGPATSNSEFHLQDTGLWMRVHHNLGELMSEELTLRIREGCPKPDRFEDHQTVNKFGLSSWHILPQDRAKGSDTTYSYSQKCKIRLPINFCGQLFGVANSMSHMGNHWAAGSQMMAISSVLFMTLLFLKELGF